MSIDRTQCDIILMRIYLSKSLHNFRFNRLTGFPERVLHESDENFWFRCVDNLEWNLE